MTIVKKLVNHFRAAYPCLAILTSEEKRAQADVLNAAKQLKRKIATWSGSEGLVYIDTGKEIPDTGELGMALNYIQQNQQGETVYILRDIHQWLPLLAPQALRLLRDVITDAPNRRSTVVIIAPSFSPMDTIKNLVTVIDYSLPSREELAAIAKGIQDGADKKIKEASLDIIKALSGLSTTEAENALALSVIETGEFDAEVIYREKVAAVKRSGLLQIIDPDPKGLDAIGGLENLKQWIIERADAFSTDAEAYGLPAPKGSLLAGVPGTGKSLSAQAIGTGLGIPTVKLSIPSLFDSLVGASEKRTQEALNLADAVAPCVLWCDEIDKGLSGSTGNGSNDGGVARKVLGLILDWMDRQKGVFFVATANQIEGVLPPELLRRFDELFAVDLPTAIEREQIAAIHIEKRGRKAATYDLAKISECTKDFSGGEIEKTIKAAMYIAYNDKDYLKKSKKRREFSTEDILAAAARMVPISKTMPEQIEAIRRWGETRARPASIKAQATVSTGRKIKV